MLPAPHARSFRARAPLICLRVAALLRAAVIVVGARRLIEARWLGAGLAIMAVGCAVGLWLRRIWPWRVALSADIALVVITALVLIDDEKIVLFSYISGTALVDVILLGLGQAALDPTSAFRRDPDTWGEPPED